MFCVQDAKKNHRRDQSFGLLGHLELPHPRQSHRQYRSVQSCIDCGYGNAELLGMDVQA